MSKELHVRDQREEGEVAGAVVSRDYAPDP